MTTSVTDAECVRVPLALVFVPVMVTLKLPVGVEALVDTVIVEEVVGAVGLKVALAPFGNPLALKPTDPAKPPVGEMLRV